MPRRDTVADTFNGALAEETVKNTSGIATILSEAQGRQLLGSAIPTSGRTIYTIKPLPRRYYGFYTNRSQYDLWRILPKDRTEDMRQTLARLRAIKQPSEVEAIKKAISITQSGLEAVFAQLGSLTYEYEVEALLSYQFRRLGANGHAFTPIVANGSNACTLHYCKNNNALHHGQLLVMDVGACLAAYSADVTRTVALGKPNVRQEAIFSAVRRIHDEAIQLCRPGQLIEAYIQTVERLIGRELMGLGLLKDAADRNGLYKWMPHAISHGLGLDVHDSLGNLEFFQEGMVMTVEPGIYIPNEAIGIRIEDDVLITAAGPVVLSADISSALSYI